MSNGLTDEYDLSDVAEEAPLDPNACVICGATPEPDYEMPFCAPCRQQHVRYPIPIGIWITAGVVGVLMLIALVRFPAQFNAARAFERGKEHRQAGRWVQASQELRTARTIFGDESRILVPLLESLAAQNDPNAMVEAARILEKLEGRKAGREEIMRVESAASQLEATFRRLEKKK